MFKHLMFKHETRNADGQADGGRTHGTRNEKRQNFGRNATKHDPPYNKKRRFRTRAVRVQGQGTQILPISDMRIFAYGLVGYRITEQDA